MSIEAGFDEKDSEEELNSTDQAELEEEAARYHHDDDPFVALTDTACAPSSKEEFASSKEEIWIKEIQSLQSTISNLAGQIQQLKMQQELQPLQAPQWDSSNIGGYGPPPPFEPTAPVNSSGAKTSRSSAFVISYTFATHVSFTISIKKGA